MIGGSDQVLANPGIAPSEIFDAVVRIIRHRWPEAIVQDTESGERYGSYASVPFGQVRELFVYRDDAAFASWEQLGADVSNTNSMVHVIADEDELTIVVDDPNEPVMVSLLSEMRRLLEARMGWLEAA